MSHVDDRAVPAAHPARHAQAPDGAATRRLVHLITPGDHYSPRTGSAVPTVVHGLSAAGPASPRPAVAVARGTYPERYDSAQALEYDEVPVGRWDRHLDVAASAVGLPRSRARRRWAAVVDRQDSWEPSVVLGHNAVEAVPVIDAARHAPVLYAHNELLRTYPPYAAGRSLENAAAIVCVSAFIAERTAARLPRSLRDRLAVVHNGVDATLFAPRDPAGVEAGGHGGHGGHGTLEVLLVGRLTPNKGSDVAVEAVRLLDRADVRLTIVGSRGFTASEQPDPYERAVTRAAAALGDRVRLRPFAPRAEIAAAMSAADVVLVPSTWDDPCPLTALEGLASGAALVASRVGGIPEIVADAGILVPPRDPAALAAAIGRLADDRAELAAYRARGRAHAEANDWAAAAARLAQVVGTLP